MGVKQHCAPLAKADVPIEYEFTGEYIDVSGEMPTLFICFPQHKLNLKIYFVVYSLMDHAVFVEQMEV